MTTSDRPTSPGALPTTSGRAPAAVFVWVWLPGANVPVVAGRLDQRGDVATFTYGRSYLQRADAVSLYLPELPLVRGVIEPPPGLTIASAMRDAAPDAWGQRVILSRHTGRLGSGSDTGDLSMLTYLLESGSNRIGALDFQESPIDYVPREQAASLEQLQNAAADLEEGRPLPDALAVALTRGTSIGGARPKASVVDGRRQLIAKFPSTSDTYPVVKAEAAAMHLARAAGVEVPDVELVRVAGKDVLLIERFDRPPGAPGTRRMMVSALTLAGLDEVFGRYATYWELADLIRARFTDAEPTLHQLFRRIVFNICVGNTDDHARNHAAFWDGSMLALTPAYDLCPQPRSGEQAQQALAISPDGSRSSQIATCVRAAGHYLLGADAAAHIADDVVDHVRAGWPDAADRAQLTQTERDRLWGRQILNPFTFY